MPLQTEVNWILDEGDRGMAIDDFRLTIEEC